MARGCCSSESGQFSSLKPSLFESILACAFFLFLGLGLVGRLVFLDVWFIVIGQVSFRVQAMGVMGASGCLLGGGL